MQCTTTPFYYIIVLNHCDIKPQSYSCIILINIVTHDPDQMYVLLLHALEWLTVVARDILLRQMMIMTFPFQLLYPPRSAKRYACWVCHQKWKCGLTASSQTYHVLPITISMMEFTALLFLSLPLLIA